MSQQQQLLKQELTVSQILRIHGKELDKSVSDIQMGMMEDVPSGVIMSYYGWKGKDDSHTGEKLLGASIVLRHTGVSKDLIIRLNDSGKTFEEIADYLDNIIPEK